MGIPATGYASAVITNPGGNLTDFTLMINLAVLIAEAADFSAGWNTDTGGYGKAVKNDGVTELATDWIDIDNVAETGWVRIKWSGTLASAGEQIIRIYPPHTDNDLYAAADTYGSDNAYIAAVEGYWPLDETSGTIFDRTSNNVDGTVNNALSSATAQMGTSYDFDGVDDYIDFGSSPAGGLSAITVMMWVRPDGTTSEMILEDGTTFSSNAFYVYLNAGKPEVQIYANSGQDVYTDNNTLSTAVFTHIALVWASASRILLYRDGVLVTTGTQGGTQRTGTLQAGNRNLILGGRPASPITLDYEGFIDDMIMTSSALSADWIAEEYSQTNDNASFWGAWSWTSPGANAPTADLQGPLVGPFGGPSMYRFIGG